MRKTRTTLAIAAISLISFAAAARGPGASDPKSNGHRKAADKAGKRVSYPPCAGPPTDDERQAAKGLFAAGKVSYKEADYPKAIKYWGEALGRDCTATRLMLNLANAYERHGDLDGAIVSLETYLERNPDDKDGPSLRKRIENMRKRRDEQAKAAAAASASASAAPTAAPTAAPSATDSGEDKGPGIAPWVVTGVGGAVAVTGVALFFVGNGKVSDADAACPDRAACSNPTAVDDGNSGRQLMIVGGVLGGLGLAAAGGGIYWALSSKKDENASAKGVPFVAPAFGPGYAGFSAAGRF